MNRLKHYARPAGVLLAMLLVPLYGYAGFSLSGGNWDIGGIYPDWTTSTSATKWTVTLDGSPYEYLVYISVQGSGSHNPSSDGNNGVNKFVLKELPQDRLVTTAEFILTTMGADTSHQFGLWFKAPADGSDPGSFSPTVTITAEPWFTLPGLDEWILVDGYLSAVGTGNGHYIMWPRPVSCEATNYDDLLQWKIAADVGFSTWSFTTKRYPPPQDSDSSLSNYPAYKWINDLNAGNGYRGLKDWRLPTGADTDPQHQIGPTSGGELKYLYNNLFNSGVDVTAQYYWSSTYNGQTDAKAVRFSDGNVVNAAKTTSYRVRAVRSSK